MKFLNEHHLGQLFKSSIKEGVARECGVYSENRPEILSKILGMNYTNFSETNDALVFPYHSLCEKREIIGYSIRPDKPKDPKRKYLKQLNNPNRLYIPKSISLERLKDTSTPIFITEGEKKALAGASWGGIVISIGGVWSWKTKSKENRDESIPIPEFYDIPMKRRKIVICFDSDISSNQNILEAECELAKFLTLERQAEVYCVRIP